MFDEEWFGSQYVFEHQEDEKYSLLRKTIVQCMESYVRKNVEHIRRTFIIASNRTFLPINKYAQRMLPVYPLFRYLSVKVPYKVSVSFHFTFKRIDIENKQRKPRDFKQYYNLYLARQGCWYLQEDFSELYRILCSRKLINIVIAKIQQQSMENI